MRYIQNNSGNEISPESGELWSILQLDRDWSDLSKFNRAEEVLIIGMRLGLHSFVPQSSDCSISLIETTFLFVVKISVTAIKEEVEHQK